MINFSKISNNSLMGRKYNSIDIELYEFAKNLFSEKDKL